ncbi:putative FERM domain-containing protein FRMD8P1 isoform X4 [Anabrus simplex]|uniref:putative FERM domain-containing protein FRMD8P1 isoform X4 n=1 Tax=Anabrus simplex TaxID=316456 RepID=UPI0035A2AA86
MYLITEFELVGYVGHLVMSSSGTERGGMEAHQVDSGQNYITVIPVEYARSRVYPQPSEYLVEPYNDYLRDRNRDDYIRADFSINSDSKFDDVGLLYTVSQRFDREKPHLNIAGGYVERERDWERALQSHTGSTDASQQVKENTVATNLELQVGEPQKSLQNALKSLKLCVYLMSRIVVHMDLEDGPNTTVQDLVQSLLQEEQLSLPRVAASIFTIWMCSGLLELQLKPYHKPYEVRQKWPMFLSKYSIASESRMERDEPVLSFQRNVFFSKRDEEKIKEQQDKFLPAHVSRSNWSWLRISGKNSPEVRLLEQFKRIPTSTTVRKLVRKYLEFCWSLPYYGAAFFQGQVEQPVRGLTSLITHQDMSVLIAINAQGVYVIDNVQCTLLLGLKYEELSWDFAKPSQEDNPDCLPCLFLQFMVLENGTRVSKILQVFSKQAVMMDALISVFVEEMKMKAVAYADETDRPIYDTSTDSDDTQMPLTMVNRRELPQSCLSNKLSKLTLATFDEDGRCIGQMGSWSFSY